MSELVTLSHPDLEQTIRIDRRRIGPRLAAGWTEVTETTPPKPELGEDSKTEAPKRRGRTTSEEK